MKASRLLLSIGLSATLILPGACGKKEDAPPRYNRTLGDSAAGAPLGTPKVDTGIMQDPSSYQPANYTPLGGFASGGPGAAGGGSEEEQAVRERMGDVLSAAIEFDFDTLLEAFVPEQVEALQDHVSAMYETVDKVKVLQRSVQEKMGEFAGVDPATLEAQNELLPKYLQKLVEVTTGSLTVDVLDDEHAAVGLEQESFQEGLRDLADEFAAELSELDPNAGAQFSQQIEMAKAMVASQAAGAEGDEAGAAISDLTVPLRRIDDQWAIELPFTITEEQAGVVGDALVLAQDFCDKFNEKLDSAETVDQTTLQMIGQQTAMELMGPAMELFMKAQQVFELGDLGEMGLNAPDEGEAEGEGSEEEEEPGIVGP